MVEAAHQIRQFGIVEVEFQRRRVWLAAEQPQPVPALLPVDQGFDLHRGAIGTEGARHPTHQVAGIGQHHGQQGLKVVAFPLQRWASDQVELPAHQDADRIVGLGGR